jgi:hypothetical protein
MDHQAHFFPFQQDPEYTFDGVQVLRLSMGWINDNGSVLLCGIYGGYFCCGVVDYPQAVELLALGIQHSQRLPI